MFCEVCTLRSQGKRLRRSEYPAAVRGRVQVTVWPHNNFQRFIRRIEVVERSGVTSLRTRLSMADPVLLPCPADVGMLLAGTEVAIIDDRIHEFSQLWLMRPCTDSEVLPPVHWAHLSKYIPTP